MMRTHTEVLVVWLARSPGGSSANVILHSTRPPLEDGRSGPHRGKNPSTTFVRVSDRIRLIKDFRKRMRRVYSHRRFWECCRSPLPPQGNAAIPKVSYSDCSLGGLGVHFFSSQILDWISSLYISIHSFFFLPTNQSHDVIAGEERNLRKDYWKSPACFR